MPDQVRGGQSDVGREDAGGGYLGDPVHGRARPRLPEEWHGAPVGTIVGGTAGVGRRPVLGEEPMVELAAVLDPEGAMRNRQRQRPDAVPRRASRK
jgi:hypothetical protein